MLPVQDVPQLPKSAWDVLSTVDFVLKRWPQAPVNGIESEMAATPVTLGSLPYRSSTLSFSYFAPQNDCELHINMYVHIYIYGIY
jgi:hypothetical protein